MNICSDKIESENLLVKLLHTHVPRDPISEVSKLSIRYSKESVNELKTLG